MGAPTKETIPDLLIANIPRGILMGVEEALTVGAQRAFTAAHGMDEGHLPHVVGQLRHFHMNEAFQRSLSASGASPSPIRGNAIITGSAGVFRLARFNISAGIWNNGRRSKTRRQMSIANTAIEPLVQPDLFKEYVPPTEAVVFFVACFSSSLRLQPDSPVSIQIAVPDRHMQSWLFRESITAFILRYDQKPATQHDLASPKLKKSVGKQQEKDGTK
jgi:hypothetical protein